VLAAALAFVETSGAKGYEPLVRLERAELARLSGDEATRQRELRAAHRLFTEIGATGHIERLAKGLELRTTAPGFKRNDPKNGAEGI
jgi:hypothetical protein